MQDDSTRPLRGLITVSEALRQLGRMKLGLRFPSHSNRTVSLPFSIILTPRLVAYLDKYKFRFTNEEFPGKFKDLSRWQLADLVTQELDHSQQHAVGVPATEWWFASLDRNRIRFNVTIELRFLGNLQGEPCAYPFAHFACLGAHPGRPDCHQRLFKVLRGYRKPNRKSLFPGFPKQDKLEAGLPLCSVLGDFETTASLHSRFFGSNREGVKVDAETLDPNPRSSLLVPRKHHEQVRARWEAEIRAMLERIPGIKESWK